MAALNSTRRHVAGAGIVVRAFAAALVILVAACSSLTPRVVSPKLDGRAVATSVSEHKILIEALRADADVLGYGGSDWYEVALAGFNYVDDECAVYFDSLFAFNRRTAAIKSGLNAFDQTTSAILQITGTASVTMGVIAQAFGLAGSMTDVVAGTFLYELPPANTQKFVQKTMAAYKQAADDKRGSINSPASAYSAVRGYLNMCLPVTIEGQLIEHISDSVAEPKAGRTGTNIEVSVRSAGPADVLANADIRLPAVALPPAEAPGLNAYEKLVRRGQWEAVQLAICAEVDGNPGSATHEAMAEFFDGYGEPDPEITTRGIGPVQMDALRKAVREANGQSCADRQVANAREAGALVK